MGTRIQYEAVMSALDNLFNAPNAAQKDVRESLVAIKESVDTKLELLDHAGESE